MRNVYASVVFALSVIFWASGCYKEKNYDPSLLAQYDDSITVYADRTMIPADSVSLSKIIIRLPFNADSTKSSVTLRTDLGTFVESGNQTLTVTAKNNTDSIKKIAIGTLKAGTITGMAHIQCIFITTNRFLTDTFYTAYPDFLNLSASTLTAKAVNTAAGEITFNCRLFKTQGVPSQRNSVTMRVLDSLNRPIGAFRSYNNLSDATGNTQFVYVIGDSALNGRLYYGKLTAIATAPKNNSGDSLTTSITVFSTQ